MTELNMLSSSLTCQFQIKVKLGCQGHEWDLYSTNKGGERGLRDGYAHYFTCSVQCIVLISLQFNFSHYIGLVYKVLYYLCIIAKDTDSAISFLLHVCAQSGWSDRHRAGTEPEQEEETPQCFLDTGQAINSSGVCVPDLLTYCCHATVVMWNGI